MGEEDEDAEDGEDGSKQGSDGNKTPVGEGGNGDIAAVEKSAEVTGEKNRKTEKTRTRKRAGKKARVNQGHEVVEGDDQGEGGSVEETEEDAEPGATASSKAVSEVEAQTGNGTTTPEVESETAEQKGSADGEGHGEVGQVEGRDASQSGMSASELVKQAVDAAGSGPDAETGNLEPASTQTDADPQLSDPSQSAELKHDVEDPQAGGSQSHHPSGDGSQDNTGENAPPAEQGTTSSLLPVVAQSGNGVEVTANKEQKSGDGGDQDDQDASKDDMASESGATVYEPAVDDIENRRDGDGLMEGQSGIDDQGESAAAKG